MRNFYSIIKDFEKCIFCNLKSEIKCQYSCYEFYKNSLSFFNKDKYLLFTQSLSNIENYYIKITENKITNTGIDINNFQLHNLFFDINCNHCSDYINSFQYNIKFKLNMEEIFKEECKINIYFLDIHKHIEYKTFGLFSTSDENQYSFGYKHGLNKAKFYIENLCRNDIIKIFDNLEFI